MIEGIVLVLLGALHIGAHYAEREALRRWTKVLPIVAVLGWVLLRDPVVPERYRWLVVLGLVASMGGDVMLLDAHRFRAGLACFLVAHLCYVAAFLTPPWLVPSAAPTLALVLAAVGMLGVLLPRTGREAPAVALYVAAIAAMAIGALGRAAALPSVGTSAAVVGAITFMASDGVLAVNRFVRPFGAAQAIVMTTYYLAQALIGWSVWAGR